MSLKIELSQDKCNSSLVSAKVSNASNRVLSILKWQSPLDDVPNDIYSISQSGYKLDLKYIGPTYARQFDKKNSVVTLNPGQDIIKTFDLSGNYGFEWDGVYQISLSSSVRFRTIGEQRDLQFTSKKCDFNCKARAIRPPVEENGDASNVTPRNVSMSKAPVQCPPIAVFCRPPSIGNANSGFCIGHIWISDPPFHNSVSASERKKITGLYTGLVKRIYRHSIQDNAAYQKWFGAYSYANANRVKSVLLGMHGGYGCKGFRIYNINTGCGTDTLAYHQASPPTHPDVINFCPIFWNLPDKGLNSKVGTIAHEISHYYRNTVDYFYRYDECLALATSDPSRAIENANNYSFYIEEYIAV